jgi:hypothetical protein
VVHNDNQKDKLTFVDKEMDTITHKKDTMMNKSDSMMYKLVKKLKEDNQELGA